MSFERIRNRLTNGHPLLVDADSGASLKARGVDVDAPGTLGVLLREQPNEVLSHHQAAIDSHVDVLSALTIDTTPRALAEVGMQHRSAQLTGRALELAFDAVSDVERPIAVAGLLGADTLAPVALDRLHEELAEHAARLRASGSELVIARGQGSRSGLMAAVVASARLGMPTWAVLELVGVNDESLPTPDTLRALRDAGASVVLLEVPTVAIGRYELDRAIATFDALGMIAGVLLAASETALRGFDDPTIEPEIWAQRAAELSAAGARVVGGGAGTTEAHTRALAFALGSLHPSVACRAFG